MKCIRLIFLFFIIPGLVHAGQINDKEYEKYVKKIVEEWDRHVELIAKFNKLSLEEKENNFAILNKSIACCERAIEHCEYVLDKISEKPKVIRHNYYWAKAKNERTQDKKNLKAEI